MANVGRNRRRKHVYGIVVPTLFALSTPLLFMSAEVCSCYIKAYFDASASAEGKMSNECVGIYVGIYPLLNLMAIGAALSVMFVNSQVPLSFEVFVRLQFGVLEGIQVAIFGICACYAVLSYCMRREREFDTTSPEGLVYLGYFAMLYSAVVMNAFKKAEGGEKGGDDDRQTDRLSKRKLVGSRKSLWEGGTKGLAKGISSGSGVGEEKGRAGGEIKEEMFNPGFM
jgi:hypothetical protein